MHVLLAMIMIGLCLTVIGFAFARPHPVLLFLATLCTFALGYYGLPMLMIERSIMRYLPEAEIVAPIAMVLLFFMAMLVGVLAVMARSTGIRGLEFPELDRLVARHWWVGMILSNAIVLYRNSSRLLTFYQAGVEAFLDQRTLLDGLIGFLIGLAQALSAIYFTLALHKRDRVRIAAAGFAIALQLASVATAGQRLVFITPLILVLAALVAQRRYRMAGTALGVAVGALLIISPFAVALRSGVWTGQQDVIAENFSYGEDPVSTVLQSIVDRADILPNMVALKAHVDAYGTVGATYYLSVASIPIPRFFYPDKPYVLSDTGTIDGEASVLAWRLMVGPTIGSLSAFGPIIAYREGGWLWVPMNAFLNGALIAFLLTMFYRGGLVGQTFFVLGFQSWAVRKVPTSLMETMVDVMTYLPIMVALYILNRFLAGELRVKRAEGSVAHLGS